MPPAADHAPADADASRAAARRLAWGLLSLALALSPRPAALAQDAATEPGTAAVSEEEQAAIERAEDERPRVAVLLIATGDLDPVTADGLTELLIGAVAARGGLRILGKEEFQAQLGQGEAGTLECISSMPCIGRVGVELGVREVIAGTLARRGEGWVFNLDRVDVASGRALGRVFREVEGDLGAVADALSEAVPDLYAPPEATPAAPEEEESVPAPPAHASLVLTVPEGAEVTVDGEVVGIGAGEPLRRDALAPGTHEVRVRAPGLTTWSRRVALAPGAEVHLEPRLAPASRVVERVHPLVWIGAGVAAAALAGGVALGIASQDRLEPTREERLGGTVTRAELVAYYDAREREAIVADVLFGLAGAAAVAGVVALFFPERETVSADVALWPGGGGAIARGRF